MARRNEKPMYYEYIHGKETFNEEDAQEQDELASLKAKSESGESSDFPHKGHRNSLSLNFDRFNSNPREPVQNDEDIESEFELEDVHLARAHWIQLFKTNMQTSIVQHTFIYMLQKYKHMRPIWIFSRKIDDNNERWVEELMEDIKFRHHSASIQAALTMIMDSMDDINQMEKLCQEIGAHHFFYDAYEPYLEIVQESFVETMKSLLMGTTERLDTQLENAWNQFWSKIKADLGYGIALQRHAYLAQCVTPSEMIQVRQMWDLVKKHGLEDAGKMVTAAALRTYEALSDAFQIDLHITLNERTQAFIDFSKKIMEALNAAIEIYTIERGFERLPMVLKNFVCECIMLEVCPSLVRKAFMEGLINMLTYVLGEVNMNEVAVHQWSKIYRVLEQAIITNIVNY
uniref:Globin family profile domain-containing protein n=1 Tax=Acrobeloides nanus TaxID=290746 RepID=A0A914D9N4_9BILA